MTDHPTTPPGPRQDIGSPPLRRAMFPRLTDEQWRERRRILKRRHHKYWQEHAQQCEALLQPRPAKIIDYVARIYERQRRDARRQARRASGKFV